MSKSKRRRSLTPAEWQDLADKQQQIERLMAECETLLTKTLTVGATQPYRKAWGKVQSLRGRMEDLSIGQGQNLGLFFGPSWTYRANWR